MTPERRNAIHQAMVRLADGERSAIDGLVAELWPVLLDFARRSLPSEQDAEDVAQEVFLRICSRISELDRARDGLSWAFGIAHYEVLTQRRQLRRRRELADQALELHIDGHPLPDERLMHEQLLSALAAAVGELTAEDRSALGLAAAPAGAESANGATLRKRKQRALERLRDMWRGLYGRP